MSTPRPILPRPSRFPDLSLCITCSPCKSSGPPGAAHTALSAPNAALRTFIKNHKFAPDHIFPSPPAMLQTADESRVLVIYTGGTIGMLPGPAGYVPEPFYLTETLRAQQRFHDPLGDSLFSHSRSVQGFREWSGRNTPINSPKATTSVFQLSGIDTQLTELGRPTTTPSPPGPPTLLVRSSRPLTVPPRSGLTPNGMINSDEYFMPKCKKIHDHCYEIHLPSLVTPASPAPGGNLKRIRYAVLEVSDEQSESATY